MKEGAAVNFMEIRPPMDCAKSSEIGDNTPKTSPKTR